MKKFNGTLEATKAVRLLCKTACQITVKKQKTVVLLTDSRAVST